MSSSTPASAAEPGSPSPADVLDEPRAGRLAIRGGALRTVGYVVAMLLSLASAPFMIRHLGKVQYGYFVTVSAMIFIISGVTEAGLTNLGTREYAALPDSERTVFMRNLVGLRLVLTVVGVAVAAGISAFTGKPSVIVEGTIVAGVGMMLALTQQTYSVTLLAELRLGWVATLELIRQFVVALTTILLVVAGAALLPFFFTTVASGAVVLACTLLVLRQESAIKPSFDWSVWRGVMHKVLPYALAAAVGVIYFRLAIVLMGYVASAQATGVYAAAFRIVETLSVVPWLVASSGFPILARAARDDLERLRYGMQRLFDVSLLLGGWIALAVAVGAPFGIAVVAGRPQFDASIPVLRLQALSLVTSFLVAVWSFALLALGRYRALLVANAAATVASAGLTVALVPGLGAKGGALATFGAEAVLAIGYLIALVRHRRTLLPQMGVGMRMLPGLGVAIVLAVVVPLPSVVMVFVVSIVFWGSALLCRAVPPELIAAARRGRLDSAL